MVGQSRIKKEDKIIFILDYVDLSNKILMKCYKLHFQGRVLTSIFPVCDTQSHDKTVNNSMIDVPLNQRSSELTVVLLVTVCW